MHSGIVLPPDSALFRAFTEVVSTHRIVLFAGLPAVGKSLYLQQLALMAQQAGRKVHLLQWDVTRAAFESERMLQRYPETDGITHPRIRKAVGLWSRRGVHAWHMRHPEPEHMLIGEVPLVGNRLIELVQVRDDDSEGLLAGDQSLFMIPVPSRNVRAHIEAARQATIASPRHQRELADAPTNVVRQNWQAIYSLAVNLGFATGDEIDPAYDPDVYRNAYRYLLQHRHHRALDVEDLLPVVQSVYALECIESELIADDQDAAATFAAVEAEYTEESIEQAIADWYVL